MNGAEFIVQILENNSTKQAFMVNGGGAMYLNDAFSKSKLINITYCHHEQACAMAAVGYSKYAQDTPVVVTSTGCGSTNAMTGLLDAWQDGCRVLFLSGNVPLAEVEKVGMGKKRKHGVQSANIIELVKPITVYSEIVRSVKDIRNQLYYAFNAMLLKRGPVWLDIPMDVQSKMHEEKEEMLHTGILRAKKPIVVAGYGVRQSLLDREFVKFIEKNKIPFVTTYLGIDYLPSDHELNIGRLGTKGDRAGNYAVRQSDLVIVLGSSLTVSVTGYGDEFSRLNVLNINDENGLMDIKEFFSTWESSHIEAKFSTNKEWRDQCLAWKKQWPVFQSEYNDVTNGINIYLLLEKIHEYSNDDAVLVSDAGSVFYATSQAYRIKGTQRYITSGGQADMGFSLPAAIGAALASGKQIIALTGDGSVQMNIQELGTLSKLRHLDIKLIVVNNGGYLSIRNTAKKFFEGYIMGTDETNGLFLPYLGKICEAYDLPYTKIEGGGLWQLEKIFNRKGAEIVEVICQKDQEILPCAAKGHGLDDMYPFINKEA